MIDSDTNQDYYQIPSDKILQNRRAFYTLWRRCDDGTERWSKRIQSCIRRCDFPMIIMEFLLFDRFVCGLDDDKLKSAESVNKSWTLKQLLEFYADKNTDVARTGPMKSKSALNDNVRPSKNVAHNVRRSDPVSLLFAQISFMHIDEIRKIKFSILILFFRIKTRAFKSNAANW